MGEMADSQLQDEPLDIPRARRWSPWILVLWAFFAAGFTLLSFFTSEYECGFIFCGHDYWVEVPALALGLLGFMLGYAIFGEHRIRYVLGALLQVAGILFLCYVAGFIAIRAWTDYRDETDYAAFSELTLTMRNTNTREILSEFKGESLIYYVVEGELYASRDVDEVSLWQAHGLIDNGGDVKKAFVSVKTHNRDGAVDDWPQRCSKVGTGPIGPNRGEYVCYVFEPNRRSALNTNGDPLFSPGALQAIELELSPKIGRRYGTTSVLVEF